MHKSLSVKLIKLANLFNHKNLTKEANIINKILLASDDLIKIKDISDEEISISYLSNKGLYKGEDASPAEYDSHEVSLKDIFGPHVFLIQEIDKNKKSSYGYLIHPDVNAIDAAKSAMDGRVLSEKQEDDLFNDATMKFSNENEVFAELQKLAQSHLD